jgi:hypothetical protein
MRWVSQILLAKVKDNEEMGINLKSWTDNSKGKSMYVMVLGVCNKNFYLIGKNYTAISSPFQVGRQCWNLLLQNLNRILPPFEFVMSIFLLPTQAHIKLFNIQHKENTILQYTLLCFSHF